jgi:hypothetical protein
MVGVARFVGAEPCSTSTTSLPEPAEAMMVDSTATLHIVFEMA